MRLRSVAVLTALALVLGGVAGWLLHDSDDEASPPRDTHPTPTLALLDVDAVSSRTPVWWSDGVDSLRLSATASGFEVDDVLRRTRWEGTPATEARFDAKAVLTPQAVAALPGSQGDTWIAVLSPGRAPNSERDSFRATTWSGNATDTTDRANVPVDISAEWAPDTHLDVDVALARNGDGVGALLLVQESRDDLGQRAIDELTLLACTDITDCTWQPIELPVPASTGVTGLASTGDGYVLVTGQRDESRKVWHAAASAGDLDWQEVGGATDDAEPLVVQDGNGKAWIVWRHTPEDRPSRYEVQLVQGGKATTPVEASRADGRPTITGVAEHDGIWYLAGSIDGMSRREVRLGHPAPTPRLFQHRDGRWHTVEAGIQSSQPLQRFVAMVSDPESSDDLELASHATVGITMVWRVEPPRD